jgi:hypothetical protein
VPRINKTQYWIIAGGWQEFTAYVRDIAKNHPELLDKYEYLYVLDPSVLRGLKEIHGSFIGTWYELEDASEIYAIIRASHMRYYDDETTDPMDKVKQIILEHHNK